MFLIYFNSDLRENIVPGSRPMAHSFHLKFLSAYRTWRSPITHTLSHVVGFLFLHVSIEKRYECSSTAFLVRLSGLLS